MNISSSGEACAKLALEHPVHEIPFPARTWVLREGEPFRGSVQSVLCTDGTVAYSDGKTVAEYEAERGFKVRLIDDAELDRLLADFLAGMVTAPEPCTEDAYTYALEVLPPSRWHTVSGWSVFHVCERITHDLVNWYASRNDEYRTWTDHASVSDSDITAKLLTPSK